MELLPRGCGEEREDWKMFHWEQWGRAQSLRKENKNNKKNLIMQPKHLNLSTKSEWVRL